MELAANVAFAVVAYVGFGFVIPIYAHELGHVAAAKLVGASFEYLPLGPFIRIHDATGPRWLRRWRRGACAATLPVDAERASTQLAIAAAGGPLLNVLVSAALVVGGVFYATSATQFVIVTGGILGLMASIGFLIPGKPYGAPSDTARLLAFVRGSPRWRRWVALRRIATATEHGVRPRAWDQGLVQTLVQESDGSLDDVSAALSVHWYFLDLRELSSARLALERARVAASRHYVKELNARIVLLELAYMEARFGEDPAQAARDLFRSAAIAPATLMRALAAVQLSYSYFREAEALARAGLADMRLLRPGFAKLEHDLLTDLIEEVDRRREASPRPREAQLEAASNVDVTAFAEPDVVPPWRAPGLRSWRGAAGLAGALLMAALGFLVFYLASPVLAIVAAAVLGALSVRPVLIARRTREPARTTRTRTALAAVGTIGLGLPLVVTRLLRVGGGSDLWIAGQPAACAHVAYDPTWLVFWLLLLPIASLALLGGTRADRERFLPMKGVLSGGVALGVIVAMFWNDASRFGWLIGCG